jgi:hypothetical protein
VFESPQTLANVLLPAFQRENLKARCGLSFPHRAQLLNTPRRSDGRHFPFPLVHRHPFRRPTFFPWGAPKLPANVLEITQALGYLSSRIDSFVLNIVVENTGRLGSPQRRRDIDQTLAEHHARFFEYLPWRAT